MLDKRDLKVNRVLSIYERLMQGHVLNKKDLATEFGVNEKSIQRDIEHIRSYLAERAIQSDLNLIYSHKKRGYVLENSQSHQLKREDVLAIVKIILGTRAFKKDEMQHLVNALLNQVNLVDQKLIKELIGNELFNYVPIRHNREILDKVWELSEIIQNRRVLEVSYTRGDNRTISRYLKPVGIIFSDYYFYLIAYMEELKPNLIDSEHFDLAHLRVFRIDRFNDYQVLKRQFYLPYANRFEEGEFKKRIPFMYMGKLLRVKFEFYGPRIEPVLDRLPTATIIEQDVNKFVVEAEVYGNEGIVMWLLTQGSNVKVLEPTSVVEQMKDELKLLTRLYAD